GLGRRSFKARRGEGEAAHEIVVRVPKEEGRGNCLVFNLVDAGVGTFVEREIEEWRDAQAFWSGPAIAKRQKAHIAGIVRGHEDNIVRFEIAAPHRERRDARLIDRIMHGVVMLKWRIARRVHVAVIKVAQVHDLRWLDCRYAVETKGGEAILASVAEG